MKPFWETKSLEEMTPQEWESLCDGCAQCCLHKLEDEDTGEIFVTQMVCDLLNLETCQCTAYGERSELVPTCITLKLQDVKVINWMPKSCAYRLLSEKKPLPSWHPLVSDQSESVITAGISVKHRAIPEKDVPEEDWPDYIVEQII